MANKKITIVFVLIALLSLVGIIGGTLAYFTSSTEFVNEFEAATYQIDVEEIFTSPDDWIPGDTTPKTLIIENKGNIDVKVRVCLEEEWESDNGDSLPLEQNGERVAIINLSNTSDWTKRGRCYYYNDSLEPNEIAPSFISGVTYNINTEPNLTCTSSTINGITTRRCDSSGNGYDDATYTLKLKIESVQSDKANVEWDAILSENRQVEGEITVGDEVSIKGEHFYVISSNSTETALLAKYKIMVGDKYEMDKSTYKLYRKEPYDDTFPLQSDGTIYFSNYYEYNFGVVSFSSESYWDKDPCYSVNTENHYPLALHGMKEEYAVNGASYNGNPYPYVYRSDLSSVAPNMVYDAYPNSQLGHPQRNGYTIAYYVEKYISVLKELTFDELDTISGRLLSYEEALSLGCTSTTCNANQSSAPRWIYSDDGYWLGSAKEQYKVFIIGDTGTLQAVDCLINSGSTVRPVIIVPTNKMPQ